MACSHHILTLQEQYHSFYFFHLGQGSGLPGESTGMVANWEKFAEGLLVPSTSSQQRAAVKKSSDALRDYLQSLKEKNKLSIRGVELDSSSEEKSSESPGN